MTVEIFRGSARFPERGESQFTWHTFSFGARYDPERVALGPMVCHDEHLLGQGHGFDTHRHTGLAIVTWVLSGALEHRDSLGGASVLEPGSVGVLYAGDGIEHSELAVAPQTRFVQVWLSSEEPASYAVSPVSAVPGAFVEACRVGESTFSVARLDAGMALTLPPGDLRHLFLARGALLRSSLAEPATAGDAFVVRGEETVSLAAAVPTDLLLWNLAG